jgi:hypothetical protein
MKRYLEGHFLLILRLVQTVEVVGLHPEPPKGSDRIPGPCHTKRTHRGSAKRSAGQGSGEHPWE